MSTLDVHAEIDSENDNYNHNDNEKGSCHV